MAEYYGVTRTPEYLMHYGVKGMRWGVRKAKESGSDQKLWRQYQKAHKKLSKLSANADIGRQKSQQLKYAKRAGIGLGVAGVGMAGMGGAKLARKHVNSSIANLIPESARKYFDSSPSNVHFSVRVPENHPDYKMFERYNKASKDVRTMNGIAGGVTLAGIGYGGYAGARSLIAKYRQTPKGHTKAVAKRDAWQKEMKSAFKDTKYANSTNPQDFGKEYYKRNKAKLDDRQKRLDAYDKKTNNRRFRQRHD